MTYSELQEEIDALPSQHPEFIIGWLMSQVVRLINEQEEDEET
jgi:hypothetical protein